MGGGYGVFMEGIVVDVENNKNEYEDENCLFIYLGSMGYVIGPILYIQCLIRRFTSVPNMNKNLLKSFLV